MSMPVTIATVEGAAKPGGHYSHAVTCGDLVFTSGQLPIQPDGSHDLANASFEDQAEQVLANLQAVLLAGGCSLGSVIKTTVYMSDMENWTAFNTIYARMFGEHRPARSVVPVGKLHFGYAVEIDAVAVRG